LHPDLFAVSGWSAVGPQLCRADAWAAANFAEEKGTSPIGGQRKARGEAGSSRNKHKGVICVRERRYSGGCEGNVKSRRYTSEVRAKRLFMLTAPVKATVYAVQGILHGPRLSD
jgi:hypothetical protein